MMLPTPPPSPRLLGLSSPEDRLGCLLGDRLKLTSILGVGAYGTVYAAVDIETNISYAVKALNKVGLDARQQAFQQREIQLHHEASHHPNVVSLVQIMDSPECIFVVLEFCPEGDLFSSITDKGQYIGNDALAKSAFLQILDAVDFCHSIGVYHRDLKPENVLVSNGGLTVKLADFGLATREYLTDDFGCGSTFYMSPECQETPARAQYYASGPNDIWSLGVILVNLTCGRNPWKRASMEDSTFRAYRQNPSFLRSILPLSPELDFILSRIFECDPQKRICIPELRNWIIRCPRFTTRSTSALPPTPPPEPQCNPEVSVQNVLEQVNAPPHALPPSPPATPPYTPFAARQQSASSNGSSISDNGSDFSTSSSSSMSSCGSLDQIQESPPPAPKHNTLTHLLSQPTFQHAIFYPCISGWPSRVPQLHNNPIPAH